MRPSFRWFVTVLAVLFALSACGRFSRHGVAEPITSIVPTTYGNVKKLPPITHFDDYKKGRKGLLRVHLFDPSNRPLAGAYITYQGPAGKGREPTNAKGIMEVLIPPGRYKVAVAPCGTTIITTDYQEAIASVVAGGQPSEGTLTGIGWKRRYYPTASVDYSTNPPWGIRESVRAALRVEDRCDFSVAKRASLATYRWKSSKNFAFEKVPPKSTDGNGDVLVNFHCVSGGDGDITVVDASGSGEEPLNILDAGAAPSGGHSFCE